MAVFSKDDGSLRECLECLLEALQTVQQLPSQFQHACLIGIGFLELRKSFLILVLAIVDVRSLEKCLAETDESLLQMNTLCPPHLMAWSLLQQGQRVVVLAQLDQGDELAFERLHLLGVQLDH